MLLRQFEIEAKRAGYQLIAGVDEAGRGPLAGPVVSAACIILNDSSLNEIRDSKKLSPKKRQRLYQELIESDTIDFGIGIVGPERIDEINILQASLESMRLAVRDLNLKPNYLLIDGNQSIGMDIADQPVVKGDAFELSIAVASVIAKVKRDELMMELDRAHPEYGFASHMGYPTKGHMEALEKHGPIEAHRKSFKPVANLIRRSYLK